MTNRGTNHTHRPRHGCHDLVPSGRYRCVTNDGRTCGISHTKPEVAATHRTVMALDDFPGTWRAEKTYLIPQYSTSELKRRRWTPTMIKKLLGNADASVFGNDQHEGMTPRNHYDCYRVHDAEIRPAFQLTVAKNAHRPSVNTSSGQEQPTVTLARTEPIVIQPPATLEELRTLAVAQVTHSETDRWAMKAHEPMDNPSLETRALAQRLVQGIIDQDPNQTSLWETDYLHDLCSNIAGEGRHTHRRTVISARVYDRLAELYPHLADICHDRAAQAHLCDRDTVEGISQQDLFEQLKPEVGYNLTNLRWTKPPASRTRPRRAATKK